MSHLRSSQRQQQGMQLGLHRMGLLEVQQGQGKQLSVTECRRDGSPTTVRDTGCGRAWVDQTLCRVMSRCNGCKPLHVRDGVWTVGHAASYIQADP